MSSKFYHNIPIPDYEQIIHCMHCGLCLATCPTYELTGLEKHSPRGRIRMIKAVADGELELTEHFQDSINFCLDCQACVTACPAGVAYGQLVEAAQLHIAHHNKIEGKRSLLKKIALDWIFADLKRLHIVAFIMRFYQIIGLEKIIQRMGIVKLLSKKLHEMSLMAPQVSPLKKYMILNNQPAQEKKNIRVGLLIGCVQDVFFRDVNQDTIDVLKISGYDVFLTQENVCCGSVHGHNGNLQMAIILAKKNIDMFENARVDYVVSNSAGCSAYMKEYGYLLQDDPEYAIRAKKFSDKVRDISEFLTANGWHHPKIFDPMKVTYHEPCHLIHAQQVSDQPRMIIKSIPNIEFIELPEASWCCGSAGIYNITRYEDSMKILERKMQNIAATGVSNVITGNPGCMIQLMYGAKKFKVNVQILHPISLLKKAYEKEGLI